MSLRDDLQMPEYIGIRVVGELIEWVESGMEEDFRTEYSYFINAGGKRHLIESQIELTAGSPKELERVVRDLSRLGSDNQRDKIQRLYRGGHFDPISSVRRLIQRNSKWKTGEFEYFHNEQKRLVTVEGLLCLKGHFGLWECREAKERHKWYWSVTHLATGHRVACGNTAAEAKKYAAILLSCYDWNFTDPKSITKADRARITDLIGNLIPAFFNKSTKDAARKILANVME